MVAYVGNRHAALPRQRFGLVQNAILQLYVISKRLYDEGEKLFRCVVFLSEKSHKFFRNDVGVLVFTGISIV
jgi:hypothetical protein